MRKKNILIPLAALMAFIAMALLLMLTVTAVPRSAIRDNAVATIDQIDEDAFHRIPKPIYNVIKPDSFTDCLMCTLVLSVDEDSIVRSAMLNPMHLRSIGNQIADTRQWAHDGRWDYRLTNYGRYWHGYQVPLTALLTVTDYRGIRLVNSILYLIFLIVALTLAWQRCSPAMSIALIVALVLTASPIAAPMSMQYIGCHLIMLAGVIATLIIPLKSGEKLYVGSTLFIIIGAITAFIDFLTLPVITLGVPVAFYVERHGSDKRRFRLFMLLCLAWAFGYGVTWASKWLLAGFFTNVDIIGDAVKTAKYRISGELPSGKGIKASAIFAHYASKITPLRATISMALLVGTTIMLRIAAGSWQRLRDNAWLLAVALLTPAWFCVIVQHSYIHRFFTWRAILVTIFAITAYIVLTVKKENSSWHHATAT